MCRHQMLRYFAFATLDAPSGAPSCLTSSTSLAPTVYVIASALVMLVVQFGIWETAGTSLP